MPAIVHKGRSVYESSVCVEYVDEVWQNEPRLLPTDPYERAVARIWVSDVRLDNYKILINVKDSQP